VSKKVYNITNIPRIPGHLKKIYCPKSIPNLVFSLPYNQIWKNGSILTQPCFKLGPNKICPKI
jgi:hypothetical protein